MRLFIAAELPEPLLDALAETQASLRDAVRGRYVAPDMLHVTLAFLGFVPGSLVSQATGALDAACAGVAPIEATLGELGSFGRPRKATLWQAVRGEGLGSLAERVRVQLCLADLPFDERDFMPHVTLMRGADLSAVSSLPMPCVARGTMDAVTLFSSDLSGPHSVYEPLHTVPLG